MEPALPGLSVRLPEVRPGGARSLDRAIRARRSTRSFAERPLALAQLAELLWAAQGISDPAGGRTTPSAAALYPLEVYVAAGGVGGLAPGTYRYRPQGHELVPVDAVDRRAALAACVYEQDWVAGAPAILVIAAVPERTTTLYGERGLRYVFLEAGHAAQNVHLQAAAAGLGTVIVGAFEDGAVKLAAALPEDTEPVVLMPVGHPG